MNEPSLRVACPAAHSMDTTWFAVDADGYVGVFDTGEDGGLPLAAAAGPEAGSFDSWPLDAVLLARGIVDGTYPWLDEPVDHYSSAARVVLVLHPDADDSPTTYRDASDRSYSIHEQLPDDGVRVLRDRDPRIVCLEHPLAPAKIERLAKDPRVAHVVDQMEALEWSWEGGGPVYRYGNRDYGDPGGYTRAAAPKEPVRLGDLSDELSDELSALRLPVTFADTEALHLADHFSDEECVTYSDTTLRGEPKEPLQAPAERAGIPRWILGLVGIGIVSVLFWLLR